MKYKELRITAARGLSETVQAALMEAGFTSMQIDDPLDAADIASHPDIYKYDYINEEIVQKAETATKGRDSGTYCVAEDEIITTFYFTDDKEGTAELERAETLLNALNAEAKIPRRGKMAQSATDIIWSVSVTGDDSEWLYKWQEHFKPTRIGERIVVKPSWEDYEPAEGDLVIEMDPGMAFGSGLHATTSMCIKALEKAMDGAYIKSFAPKTEREEEDQSGSLNEPASLKILDVGTGTGILAMAAVLLGADEALGVDIDEEAVRVSNENIAGNGLADRIDIRRGNLMDGVEYDPDIIVANLMADLVMMLSPAAAGQLSPGGIYITSGILDIKEEIVKKTIEDAGFDIIEVLADGEWRAIIARRE